MSNILAVAIKYYIEIKKLIYSFDIICHDYYNISIVIPILTIVV